MKKSTKNLINVALLALMFVAVYLLEQQFGRRSMLITVLKKGAIYALTLLLGDFISATMMTELSIVGGALIVMSGLSILKDKDFKTLDFLPALAVPVVWCLLAPLLGI